MLLTALIRVIYLAIMFLAGLVLSNLALPERFGSIYLLILNASLFSILTGLGSDSIVLHKVSNKKWNVFKAVQFTWRIIAIQIFLFFILEFASLQVWGRTLLSNDPPGYLGIEVIYFIGLLLAEKYTALLYSLHKSYFANAVLAIIGFFYLVVLVLLFYFIKASFITVVYFFALQSFLQGIALVLVFHWNRPLNRTKFSNEEFVAALKLSSVVMITNVIQLMAYRLDFWLLKYFYGSYEVGVYAQANKFANLIWIVPNILAQLLIPRFSLVDKNKMSGIFSSAFYFNLVSVLATIICANIFYYFYLNTEYQSGLPAFYLMLPGYFFWAAVIYFGAYFSWAGKFFYNLTCSSFCFILILAADLILIPRYGIKGAACANSIAYTIVFLIYLFILGKRHSFRWNDLVLLRKKELSGILKFITG